MINTCLIIGLGQIGMGYDYNLDPHKFVLSHARSFSIHPKFELIGGVDSDSERCSDFENEYKRPAYTNLKKALEILNPSIVVISTPSDSHYLIVKRLLSSHQPEAIVCEKPLDENLKQANKILKICKEKGVHLFVNYMRRSDKGVIEIKNMIDNNIIQEPIKAVAWYSKGLRHSGSHSLNLLEYWLGDILDYKIISSDRSWNNSDPEPDFKVIFNKGNAIFCASWEEFFPHMSIELLSPSGRLFYHKGGSDISWQPSGATLNKPRKRFLDDSTKIVNDLDRYQFNFVENLSLALQGKRHHISTGQDALNTLTSIQNIIEKETI